MEKDILGTPSLHRRRAEARLLKVLTLLVYLVAIAVAEWVAAYSSRQDGMVVYAFIFAIPLVSFYDLFRFAIISIPVLIATFAAMRVLEFGVDDVGLTLRRLPLQIAVALTGIPLGLAGYLILKPHTVVIGHTWEDMVLPGIIFIVCIGFVQKLIFRGMMQRASQGVLGRWGILYISLLFAILSMGQLSVLNMVFMFGVAVYFSSVVKQTGSLLGVSVAHGIMALGVYLVMPGLV